MLQLAGKIKLNKATIDSPNVCDQFSKADLDAIGRWVKDGYNIDKRSRIGWEQRTSAAMDLAMQIQETKTFPWQNCSNIAFPLVTIATLQFHAIAYPAIITGTDIVKCRVIGRDDDGTLKARADRVSTHMSWQRLEQDQSWEEQQDRLLINIACVGTAFKKSYHAAAKGYDVSELVYAKDLVLNYWSKSVEECPRKTHIIPLFRNDVYERIAQKTFRDTRDSNWYKQAPTPVRTEQQIADDKRHGVTAPAQGDETTPFRFLEQHASLDLDGDGYAEPWIITAEERTGEVVRIVARFDREEDITRDANDDIVSIQAMEYFTKYPFLPSPDGGIYDLGFGVLLGPLNESTNSIINQLVDAGTMQVTAGGFLAKGAKIRGGVYTFSPLEWKRVDATGDDLRKAIVPLEVREPSAVLFQLLGLLVQYTNRISGSTDTIVGENPGQNTPAETTRTMVEMGRKIYNGIYKRVWRAMKEEFKKLYTLNAIYLPIEGQPYPGGRARKEDYLPSPDHVIPAADPNVTSDTERVQLAFAVAERARMTAGYNRDEAERNLLKAWRVDGIDTLFGGSEKFPPPSDPKIQIEQMRAQQGTIKLQAEQARFVAQLMEDQRLNNAKIVELQASAVKLSEDAKSEKAWAMVAAVQVAIKSMEARNASLAKSIELTLKAMEVYGKIAESTGVERMENAAGDGGAPASIAPASAQPQGEMGGGGVY